MSRRSQRASIVSILLVLGLPGAAQESTEPQITRADLAAAYLRFDWAYSHAELGDERRGEIGQAFDQSTLSFFRQEFQDAIRAINALTISLIPAEETAEFQAAVALRVQTNPMVYVSGQPPPSATITRLYPVADQPGHYAVAIGASNREALWSRPFELSDVGAGYTVPLEGVNKLEPGRYHVGVQVGQVFGVSSTVSVVTESLDAVRERNGRRMEGIQNAAPNLTSAIAAVRARNELLTDSPSLERTAEFLFDPVELQREIDQEIARLEQGDDPFERRRGDYWRTLKSGDSELAMRVYCPEKAPSEGGLPLVITFHGAGTDENAFMDAYGAGALKRLADKYGFVAVSPNAYGFRGSTGVALFRAIVDEMADDYAIDRARVYLVGHSMGGGVITQLAKSAPDAVRAACGLAGFGGYGDTSDVPPTLVIATSLDPIVPASRLKPLAEAAQEHGLPVEYKEYSAQGHTTIVNDALGDAIAWLLAH